MASQDGVDCEYFLIVMIMMMKTMIRTSMVMMKMIMMKREQITLLCGFLRWSEFLMIIDIDNYDSDDGDKKFV